MAAVSGHVSCNSLKETWRQFDPQSTGYTELSNVPAFMGVRTGETRTKGWRALHR